MSLTLKEFRVLNADNWFCRYCLSELPYSHFDDDLDFLSAISENWYDLAKLDFNSLDEHIFIPFEMNEETKTYLSIFDSDPDLNFYKHNKGTSLVNSDYQIEDTHINFKKKNCLDHSVSLFHVNMRSLLPKHTKLETYLQSLQTDFKVWAD